MFNELLERLKQGYKTTDFPDTEPNLSKRYKGLPSIKCENKDCSKCAKICPTDAISFNEKYVIDLGKCIFCGDCLKECPENSIIFSDKFRMAVTNKEDLIVSDEDIKLASAAKNKIFQIFNRSLKLRVVSAGGCNACEADINVLSTIGFDLGQFGVQVVASPRHADGLIITGPVTTNMEIALKKTYEAIPEPKLVIAVGACAISGGPYRGHQEANNGVDSIIPVDLYVPGCPPHPLTILDGLIKIMGKDL